jgi:hypothetical protein
VSFLPAPLDDAPGGLTAWQINKAKRAQASAELDIFRHGLVAQTRAEFDRQDAQAVADASHTSLDLELDLLDYGMARAGQSAARLELVARHVERLASINNRRITRRFG